MACTLSLLFLLLVVMIMIMTEELKCTVNPL
jgi:hypothetical protein